MATFTYSDFKKMYPNVNACLDKIFNLRYGHLTECPECNSAVAWRKVRTRRCYQCRHCYAQFYPTAGTVFEKTTTPLLDWFYVIFLFTTTRNGVAAKEIERQLGCSYKCAWRMGHCIRKLMDKIGVDKLKGFVEIDETYNGSKKSGRGLKDKTPVVGMVERLGNVKAFAVENATRENIYPLIEQHVDKTAKVSTDESLVYYTLKSELGYNHGTINHSAGEYRRGQVSTNTIEGFFGQLKRMVHGTHLHVSKKYLQNYVGECVLRYNNRKRQHEMFEIILTHLPSFR